MSRLCSAVIFVALTALPPVAMAEQLPLPQTDFSAQWELQGAPEIDGPSRLTYSATLGKMRIDMQSEGQQMTMVRDLNGGESTMWSSMMPGMAMQMNTGADAIPNGQSTGQSDTVGGEACTVWQVEGSDICITADGIPVRSVGDGVTATMTSIDRSSQDAALFEPPAGVQVMPLPQGMPGMGGMPNMALPF
ncbi:MAG: hypothetical protein AAGD23_08850 [Pseudomonadota bacterium]